MLVTADGSASLGSTIDAVGLVATCFGLVLLASGSAAIVAGGENVFGWCAGSKRGVARGDRPELGRAGSRGESNAPWGMLGASRWKLEGCCRLDVLDTGGRLTCAAQASQK